MSEIQNFQKKFFYKNFQTKENAVPLLLLQHSPILLDFVFCVAVVSIVLAASAIESNTSKRIFFKTLYLPINQ